MQDRAPIALPAAAAVLNAHAAGDHLEVARIIDAHPLEAWFGILPDTLGPVLAAIPTEHHTEYPVVIGLRLFLSGERTTKPAVRSLDDLRGLSEFAAGFFNSRAQGAPRHALRLASHDTIAAPAAHPLYDATGGFRCFIALQRGITEFLSGDYDTALASFGDAASTAPPRPLMVLLRDAYAKAALVHAFYGSVEAARRNLDIAASLPRTESWAEAVVDASVEMAGGVIARTADLGVAAARLERLPAVLVGEMWPFWLAAVFRCHARMGNVELGRRRAEELARMTPAGAAVDGVSASILPLIRATAAYVAGDLARAMRHVDDADHRVLSAALIRALVLVASGRAVDAVPLLVTSQSRTEPLAQADSLRVMMLAWAMIELGEERTATSLLTDFVHTHATGGDSVGIVPAPVAAFAAQRVEGWPRDALPWPEHTVAELPILTPQEQRVLAELATGRTREEVAAVLFLSLNTVKSHQRAIYRKLRVPSRAAALAEASRLGLL